MDTRDADVDPVLGPRKPLVLLAYLSCQAERAAPRDRLVDLLWPDLPPRAARHALRQTVWAVRNETSPSLLHSTSHQVTLHAAVQSDREDFLTMVDRVELERAVRSFAGVFLDPIGSPAGLEIDHWLDRERRYLTLVYQRAAETLLAEWAAAGRYGDVMAIANRVLEIAPDAQIPVLKAGVAVMGFGGAVTNAGPTPERAPRSKTHLGEPPRRPPALAGLTHAFDRAVRDGALHVRFTSVKPAAGRIVEFLNWLGTQSQPVLVVHEAGPHSSHAYDLLTRLIQRLGTAPGAAGVEPASLRALQTLEPGPAASTEPDPAAVSEAVTDLWDAVAYENPVVLIVDDWVAVDRASRTALGRAFGHLRRQPVLVVTVGPTAAPEFDADRTLAVTDPPRPSGAAPVTPDPFPKRPVSAPPQVPARRALPRWVIAALLLATALGFALGRWTAGAPVHPPTNGPVVTP